MCHSLTYLMAALRKCGVLRSMDGSFNTEEQRYEQRFVAFQRLTRPDYLPYDEYRSFVDLHDTRTSPAGSCLHLSHVHLRCWKAR